MRDTMPFLFRLGLDDTTDARAIRRAYARELKLIDQERDAAGFQELREAYETALQWADYQSREPAQATAQAQQDAPAADFSIPRTPVRFGMEPAQAPAPDEPQQLASAVFGQFMEATQVLVRDHRTQHAVRWQEVLQRCLDDDRLLNLAARTMFEAHVAQLLANGWQPGHEALFVAAANVFHWAEDQRRLQQLGRAGALIDQAINERNGFDTLPESQQMIHRAVLTLLRNEAMPTDFQLRDDMPYVEMLTSYFPSWMSMVVDMKVVAQWRVRYQLLPPVKKSRWPKLSIPDVNPWSRWFTVFFLINALRLAFSHFGADAPTQPAPSAAPKVPQLQFYQLQDIQARIPRIPFVAQGAGPHRVEFSVELDDNGRVYMLHMLRTSDNRAYDDAASNAIHKSAPFPPETPRKFEISLTIPDGLEK